MNSGIIRAFSAMFFLLMLLSWPQLSVAADNPVTIGVLAHRPKPETLARFQPLARLLTRALPDQQVRLEVFSYPELEAALTARKLDFVLTNPGHYVQLRHINGMSGVLATLVEKERGHAIFSFGGVIFTRNDRSDIARLKDLKGKRIAIVGTGSLGGYQAQAYELLQAGIRLPDDARLVVTGMPHDSAVQAVLEGRADAAMVRTGVLEDMVQEGKLDLSRLKIINHQQQSGFSFVSSTRLYPQWPFVSLPHVNEKLARKVASALLGMEHSQQTSGLGGFTVPADYTPVENLLRELRLPPFEKSPSFTMADIWHRYHWQIIIFLLAGLCILVLGMRLIVTNKKHKESEERLKLVLDGSNDGFWDWDVASGRITINNRWAEMLGYANDEINNPTAEKWASLVHPDDLPWVFDAMTKHLEGLAPPFELEYRMQTKSGDWIWNLDRGKVVERDRSGKAVRVAGTHTDITNRKMTEALLLEKTMMLEQEIGERQQAQEQLADKQTQLEFLNRSLQQRVEESIAELREKDQVLINQGRQAAMGEMIGNIAHQWRQPLNALAMLITNLQFAQRDNELTEVYLNESAATANRLIQKMSTTINDFRNFFSPDKEMVPFSALQQIRHALALVEASLKNNNIDIAVEADSDSTLNGFPNEYSQVLLNLLSNAKEAIQQSCTTPGRITITLSAADGMGIMTVRDNGGGMPEEILDKIFEPYFSTKSMGTGIGLYMSKMIIERNMNGTLTARTFEGGSEFTILTPLAEGTI